MLTIRRPKGSITNGQELPGGPTGRVLSDVYPQQYSGITAVVPEGIHVRARIR